MEDDKEVKMTSTEKGNMESTADAAAVSKPKRGQPSASEESASPYPDMELCQQIHKLIVKAPEYDTPIFQTKVLTTICKELENPTLYESVEHAMGISSGIWSVADIQLRKEANQMKVQGLEAKVEDAKESAGDMEVMDARVELARYAAKSMTEQDALEAYKKLLELPKISSGKKIDAIMESARVASFYGNTKKTTEFLDSVSSAGLHDRTFDVWAPQVDVSRKTRLSLFCSMFLLFRPKSLPQKVVVVIGIVATVSRLTVGYNNFWSGIPKEQHLFSLIVLPLFPATKFVPTETSLCMPPYRICCIFLDLSLRQRSWMDPKSCRWPMTFQLW
jgi:hypothetical protein